MSSRGPHSVARGRLLSEFLVSLGLFFLILTADLSILTSASSSASKAASSLEALEIARAGMEELIASPTVGQPSRRERNFPSKADRAGSLTYTRITRVSPLKGNLSGLSQAVVTVDWDHGKVSLERYVARI